MRSVFFRPGSLWGFRNERDAKRLAASCFLKSVRHIVCVAAVEALIDVQAAPKNDFPTGVGINAAVVDRVIEGPFQVDAVRAHVLSDTVKIFDLLFRTFLVLARYDPDRDFLFGLLGDDDQPEQF